MRIVLSFLLCFVFLETQVFALQGGPEGSGGTSVDTLGTYSGALIPNTGTTGNAANTLGIFSLSMPSTGIGSGNAFIFSQGRTFSGPITAVGNPDNLKIAGIIDASFIPPSNSPTPNLNTITIVTTTTATAPTGGEAQGQFIAQVAPELDLTSTALAVLNGTAVLSVDFGMVNPDGTPVVVETLNMTLLGFKQVETASASIGTTTTGG